MTPAARTRPNEDTGAAEPGPPDAALQEFAQIRAYAQRGRLPWRRLSEKRRVRLINEDIVSRRDAGEANGKPFPLHDNHFVSAREFQRRLYARFRGEIAHAAIDGLKSAQPEDSAFRLFSSGQTALFAALTLGVCALFANWPLATLVGFNAAATLYFIGIIFFRIHLLRLAAGEQVGRTRAVCISDDELPMITILLPLYRDAEALPLLARAIAALDYPAQKMDVKLLLEEDDPETIAEARRLGLDQRYDMIVTPPLAPRTKPKACNYGMHLARGELIVIYDAEDQPEADQLKKAAAAFRDADDKLACVQARLNYYNATDNWLARMFTLEYSLWFDWLLPALQKMGAPIPLGGTSNFFRTDTLIEIGGWDPYNVTEDADLGLRIARLGLRVEILDSTTFEEANCRTGNWIRQRSRWMKGYLQTWLVHMRRPERIVTTTGWRGFWAVQLFIAGNLFSAVINPVMWAVFLIWLALTPPLIADLFPPPLLQLNIFALVAGNVFFILMMVCAPLKRGWRNLTFYGLTAPAYWLLTSLAAYKALWQAATRPHYWEKTDHVISEAARRKRNDALAAHFADGPTDLERHVNTRRIDARRTPLSQNERPRQ